MRAGVTEIGLLMLFHASIFFFSVFFAAVLEISGFLPFRWMWTLSLFFGMVLFFSRRFGGSLVSALLPVVFSCAATTLLFFVSTHMERYFFMGASSIVFYLALLGLYRLRQYPLDRTAQAMLSLVAVTTLFFLFAVFFGMFLNFRRFDELALMIALGGSVSLVGFSIFRELFVGDIRKSFLVSLLLGFFSMQIAWTASFFPFGYLTTSVISLIMLFPLWDIVSREVRHSFSKKRMAFNMIVSLALIALVVSSSEWFPMV